MYLNTCHSFSSVYKVLLCLSIIPYLCNIQMLQLHQHFMFFSKVENTKGLSV